MNYLEFVIRLVAFAVTLFFLLEFMVSCDIDTWKAAIVFSFTAVCVISIFFVTKQHVSLFCPRCKSKVSSIRYGTLISK
jgi:hypothetical protein